ncbi:MAG: FHA domain-containing protein [Nitrospira defluvii]|nr:FHA domain-containing protein [Nitrospira defluvii]
MSDDLTAALKTPPPVRIRVRVGTTWSGEQRFTHTFRIGRSADCQVVVPERVVSRVHAEVRFEANQWWLVDQQSTHGLYVNGRHVTRVPLREAVTVELGLGGPVVWLAVSDEIVFSDQPAEAAHEGAELPSVTEIVDRWKRGDTVEETEEARRYRAAAKRRERQQRRRYRVAVGVVVILLVCAVGYAWYQRARVDQMTRTAGEMFYTMKQVEIQVSELEEVVAETKRKDLMERILTKRQKLRELEAQYDRFLTELDIYEGMSEQDRLVFRMARLFGECEVAMPRDFLSEVKKYIRRWKSTERLQNAIKRARDNGLIPTVANEMWTKNLPPQFFYLAVQESGFDSKAVGPLTRMGYAKGIWQFIPQTAEQYGLKPGPLKNVAKYDPQDERFHFQKATKAAAKYIRRIYNTDAQASGLLVIASYNWGEGNVINIIRKMPNNPRERNFWQLLKQYKIPQETYDYVFYIFSAAVIAENPQLFGFDFQNPFAEQGRASK